MLFAAPLWLFAMLPWAAAVLWILWGRRKRTYVPFLDLWRGPALHKPTRRALQPPPIFLAAAIAATLAAVLAAAQPAIRSSRPAAIHPITVILDRGITMSALDHGQPRFRATAMQAVKALSAYFKRPRTPVDLWTLPGKGPSDRELENLDAAVANLPVTAFDTQASLEETIRDRLASSRGSIVVISDRRLAFDDPRLIRFAPAGPIENVGIVSVAVRETPLAQIMVRLRNDSSRKSVSLKISTAGSIIQRTVDLPGRGERRDFFLDPARFGDVVEVAVDATDDLPADNRAWLVREGSYPKLEPRTALSPELRRMIDVYARTRPPTPSSQTVAIVAAEGDLPSQIPAVIVAPATGQTARGSVTARADPIAANVDWAAFPRQVEVAGMAPKGWTPAVSVGDRAIVAYRRDPIPQAWVGFDAPAAWSATPDFVIFWANIFAWAGQGRERFASYPLTAIDASWKRVDAAVIPSAAPDTWPGLYQRSDGVMRAFNAPASAESDEVATTTADWRQRLLASEPTTPSTIDATSFALVLATACMFTAAATWKRRVAAGTSSPFLTRRRRFCF
ncbi:MAG TPA: hypothetical protein VG326_09935 [Tepidisphaeraceae bacterium]|jgi:hypothetical protein|nr:hypothetical protein [Tepidisphaeraceae bacterium]